MSSSSSDVYPLSGSSDELSDDDSVEFFYNIIRQAKELADTAGSSRKYVRRDCNEALEQLMKDFFYEDAVYDDEHFRGVFRLPKRLFLQIVNEIQATGRPFFQEEFDGRKKSFTALQKCLSALQQLADGDSAAQLDGYLKMAGRTSRECLQHFCDAVTDLYMREYLHRPTTHDLTLLHMAHEQQHHIPGMIGSIDCTHFEWKQCPTQLHGQYKRGNHKHPTIMLEAVASYDLWIWHAYFGPPGSNNDINVLMTSPLFLTQRNGTVPKSPFVVNNKTYKRGYYLADRGYQNWLTFVKAYAYPTEPKEKRFKKLQESARKDVERAFGVLKGRWGILNRPLQMRSTDRIAKVVYTCIILHNMLCKEDGRAICPVHIMDLPVEPVHDETVLPELRDEQMCARVRFDLTEHVAAQDLPYLDEEDSE